MKLDLRELIQGLEPSDNVDLSGYIIEREQLYGLEAEPLEMHNLIKKEPALAKELRGRISDWEEHNREAVPLCGW